MKKRSLLVGVFAIAIMANNYVLSMEKDQFIPGASYYIFEYNGKCNDSTTMYGSTKYATFYTFDGTEIAKADAKTKIVRVDDGTEIAKIEWFSFAPLKALLDPNAPKPQPTSCSIIYWTSNCLKYLATGISADCLINFLDKNGNSVGSYRYDKENHKIAGDDYHHDIEPLYFDETNPQAIDTKLYLEKLHLDLSKLSEVSIEETKRTLSWWPW
jgi:hypothetical protein